MKNPAFVIGLAALAFAWSGPLPSLARHSFTAHMTMHMTVVAVAAPLIALKLATFGRATNLLAPIPASVIELVVVWVWHAPALHHAAREHTVARFAEQGSFLLVALLVWVSAFARPSEGVIGLLLTSMHMTLLGALLALSPRPLYQHGGASALEDLHFGGAVMLLAGGLSYLLGGLALTSRVLRAQERG